MFDLSKLLTDFENSQKKWFEYEVSGGFHTKILTDNHTVFIDPSDENSLNVFPTSWYFLQVYLENHWNYNKLKFNHYFRDSSNNQR